MKIGKVGYENSRVDLYDLEQKCSSRLADLPGEEKDQGTAAFVNGKILTCGGFLISDPMSYQSSCHSYDPATNSWSSEESLPHAL